MDRGSNDLSLAVALSFQDRGASAGMRGFGSVMASLGGPLGIATAGFGALSLAAIGFTVKSVQMAAQYQQSMNMVQALTGASQAQMAQYDVGLKALAIDAGVAPTKLSQGLYQVISAGYSGAAAMNVLTLATRDSKIGMTDAATTSEALTNVLANFSWQTKDANQVNGIMLETVTLGKSTFQQYASTISKASATSAQFHISLQTMSAAWATMTANGISAGKASTDYVQLVQAMDGKIGTVTKSLHKNGIAFNETAFNAADFGTKVQMLNTAMQEAAQKHVTVTGVTLQAAQALTVISGHMGVYNSNLATLSNHQAMAAKTQQAWMITQGGFNQTMDRLSAAVQVLEINIGTLFLPILTRLVAAIIPVIVIAADWILQLSSLYQMFSEKLTPAVKIFSDAIYYVGYYIDRQLRPSVKLLTDEFNVLWGQLANPGQLNDTFKQTTDWMINVGTPAYNAFAVVVADVLGGSYQKLGNDARNALVATSQVGATMGKQIAESITVHVETSLKNIKIPAIKMPSMGGMPGGDMLAGLLGPLQQIGKFFSGIFQPFIDEWNRVKKDLEPSLIQFAQWWQNTMGPLFGGMGDKAKQAQSPLKTLLDIIGNMFLFFTKLAMILIEYILPLLMHWWGILAIPIGFIIGLVSKLWDFLANDGIDTIKSFFVTVSGVITNVKDAIGNVLGWIGDHIKSAVDSWKTFWSGLGSAIGGVWNGIVGFITDKLNFVIGLINNMIDVYNRLPKLGAPNLAHIPLISSASTGVGATIPSFASGVTDFQGGLAYVHQNELLVNMPRGTSVLPAGRSGGGSMQNIFYITINGKPSRADIDSLTDQISTNLAKKMRGNANIQVATSGSVRS